MISMMTLDDYTIVLYRNQPEGRFCEILVQLGVDEKRFAEIR